MPTCSPCSTVFGGALDGEAILDFIDSGRDVILAVDSRASDEIRNLASDVGVDLEPRGSAVVDDHNHVTMAHGVDHTLVVSDAVLDSAAVFGPGAIMVRLVLYTQMICKAAAVNSASHIML